MAILYFKPHQFCLWMLLFCAAGTVVAADTDRSQAGYSWNLPPGFPVPVVPADNPMSEAKVRLGRYLFYDHRLSINGQYACATCHRQNRAFSDGLNQAVGATSEIHPRNSMSLTNVAFNASLTWASADITTLEDQIRIPFFNRNPVELGLTGRERDIIDMIENDQRYRVLFRQSFPDQAQVFTVGNVIKAIAAFTRTLISGGSPYDQLVYADDRAAMSPSAWRGMRLFFSDQTRCSRCHQGFNFSGPVRYDRAAATGPSFHNTALYNVDGRGAYPAADQGLYAVTGDDIDMGKFRAPTLRNIEYTAPYMHDGSITTLEAVIDHYAKGGRSRNPYQDPFISEFEISEQEKRDLVNFLKSLSDTTFVNDPRFSDPFRVD